jgi:PAS domain S-box-containing protein
MIDRSPTELLDGAFQTLSRSVECVPSARQAAGPLVSEAQSIAQRVVESFFDSVLVLDSERRVRFANRAFHRTFDIGPDETLGKTLFDLDAGDWNIAALRDCLADPRSAVVLEAVHLEHDFRRLGPRSLLLSARPLERTQLQLLVLQDVTQRAVAGQALERREREFHAVLIQAREAILMIDLAGKLIFANDCACRLFGYPREELIGLPADRLVPEMLAGWHSQMRADRTTSLAGATPITGFGRSKDGLEFPIELTFSALARDEADSLAVLFIADVSERRESERKLRDFQEKLRVESAGASRSIYTIASGRPSRSPRSSWARSAAT